MPPQPLFDVCLYVKANTSLPPSLPSHSSPRQQGWLPNSAKALESPDIISFIRIHNNVGLWAGAFILERPTPEDRAKVRAPQFFGAH